MADSLGGFDVLQHEVNSFEFSFEKVNTDGGLLLFGGSEQALSRRCVAVGKPAHTVENVWRYLNVLAGSDKLGDDWSHLVTPVGGMAGNMLSFFSEVGVPDLFDQFKSLCGIENWRN